MKTRFWWMMALVAGVAVLRVLPLPPNFAPVTALALFGGAHFDRKWAAFAVPLAAMAVSDALRFWLFGDGLHDQIPIVYLSFAAVAGLGFLLRGRRRFPLVALAALSASALFFVTTNFGVWTLGTIYPLTAEGLLACYIAAIPFFGSTLAGDLFYTALLFGAFALAERRIPSLALPQPA